MVELRPDQVQDLGWHIANPKGINQGEPATGKTPVMCVQAWYNWRTRGKKTLWTMPKSLLKKNLDELLRFTPFTAADVEILETDHKALTKSWTGPTFIRHKKVKRKTGKMGPDGKPVTVLELVPVECADLIAASKAKVFITTFKFASLHWERLFKHHPEIDNFITDEHHMGYGGCGSKQTESFYEINRRVSHGLFATGTLINGRLDSAFPAIHVIEPKYYGSYAGFVNNHAGWIDDYGKVQVWANHDRLAQILARHSIRRTFEEVHGKEELVVDHQTVPMGEQMREVYDQFHKDAMLELEDQRFLDGSLPGPATMRAQQIMAHPETMGLCKNEPTGKDLRLEIIAAERQPMLLFASLKPEQVRIAALLNKLGVKTGLINSDVSGKDRNRIDQAFRAGELDAIVASAPTAGVGWNWERADHVINVSVDYQDVNYIQAYRRANRGTRTKPLRITNLLYEDSIDQRKYAILKAKSEDANKVDPTRKVLNFLTT